VRVADGAGGGGVGARRDPVLSVRDLRVSFRTPDRSVRAVDGTSFRVGAGEAVGLVGESGCGKTATALALMGLLPRGTGRIESGSSISFAGRELVGASPGELRGIRGRRVSMVFQDPSASLNPLHPVGEQVAEVLRYRAGLSRPAGRTRAVELLREVGIRRPEERYGDPPHRLSGGMRQRVMIAMAVACEPELVIADEPTSSLDVTVQARILDLLAHLRAAHGTALLFVSHDLAVVARLCDRVLVMREGCIVDEGRADVLLRDPGHPYTRHLIEAVPVLGRGRARSAAATHPGGRTGRDPAPRGGSPQPSSALSSSPLVVARDLVVEFARASGGRPGRLLRGRAEGPEASGADGGDGGGGDAGQGREGVLRAVDHVSFEIQPGETLGLVGESGCGKSTTARALLHLHAPDAGTVLFDGAPVGGMSRRELRVLRGRAQIVFQDPSGSLNPRMSARSTLDEVLRVHRVVEGRRARQERVADLLVRVGLEATHGDRLPHELSGGQIQRLGIARALAVEPDFVVLDEPVSALDVAVRARIVELLLSLQDEFGLTYLFIAHDLAVVEQMSDRIAVMRAGRIVEIGTAGEIVRFPRHPHTRALLEAVPERPGGGRTPPPEGTEGV